MEPENQNLKEYFDAIEDEGGVVVKDTPKLDLEAYISNYKGWLRHERLLLIGRSSVVLCVDALKAAVAEAKNGRNVRRYRTSIDLLRRVAPDLLEATLDKKWIDAIERSNREETQRLEQELKGYKNNLVRESIRMGNEDLGKHLEAIGEFSEAAEAYSRMRPDVTTQKQIVDVGKHLARVALQKRDWPAVLHNMSKLSTTGAAGKSSEDGAGVVGLSTYLRVMSGVANLGQERLREAADEFLRAEAGAPPESYADAMSANDVAICGGLLALATMDRKELQARVLDNQAFRPFLELESHLRRAISMFVNGRYSSCLEVLEGYRADYQLDVFLQRHVHQIYRQIRSKCISQYLLPFSCVEIASLNELFAINGHSIEEELVAMIRGGILDARIDKINNLLVTTSTKPRSLMQNAAIRSAREYEAEAVERLRRINLISADLDIKNPYKLKGPAGAMMVGGLDDWYGEA